MSISLPFNGSTFIIPTPNEIGWGTNLDNYLVAIASGTLQNIGGTFVLSNDVDFGGTNGIKALYYKTRSAQIAASGNFRLANATDSVSWRNVGNSADLALSVNASNQLTFNGVPLAGSGVFSANVAIKSDGSGNLTSSTTTSSELAGIHGLSGQKAVVTDSGGIITTSGTTSNEIAFVSGVTSAIQTQLNAKLNLSGGTLSGDLTFASNKGIFFTDNTSNTIKITAPTSVTTYTLKWPAAQGAANQYLTNDGSGVLSWTNAAGTGTVNTGTANTLAYYSASSNTVSSLTAITASKALVSDTNGLPVASTTTATELAFVHGVTSAIQTQLNLLAPIANPTLTGTVIINAVSGAASQLALNGATGFNSDTVRFTSKNPNSGSGSNAAIISDVESGSLNSDAYFSSIANASGGTNVNWSWGLDGSDSGAWVLTAANTLNGTNLIRIDPTNTGVAIHGTNTNNAASVGFVGEVISSTVPFASRISLTTATPINITSITLTAGNWDISASVGFVPGSNTNMTSIQTAVSLTSATLPGNAAYWSATSNGELREENEFGTGGQVFTGNFVPGLSMGSYSVSLSTSKTFYLVAQSAFSVSTNQVIGRIQGIRTS